MKMKINPIAQNTILSLYISPSNLSFIEFIIVCSLVLITSYNLNPIFLKKLHDLSVLQSTIVFNAKLICKNFLFDYFIGLFTNSYLLFLYILLYLFEITGKFF